MLSSPPHVRPPLPPSAPLPAARRRSGGPNLIQSSAPLPPLPHLDHHLHPRHLLVHREQRGGTPLLSSGDRVVAGGARPCLRWWRSWARSCPASDDVVVVGGARPHPDTDVVASYRTLNRLPAAAWWPKGRTLAMILAATQRGVVKVCLLPSSTFVLDHQRRQGWGEDGRRGGLATGRHTE